MATRTVGFDEWKDYVLGKSDGQPKTPGMGRGRERHPRPRDPGPRPRMGAKKTTLAAGGQGGWGGACRSATGNEWARTMIALAAMQGLGKPGVQHVVDHARRALRHRFWFPGYSEGGISGDA